MIDRRAATRAIEDFLRALGHDLSGDLEGTAERVVDTWVDDLLEGHSIDAAAILREGAIDAGLHDRGLVILRNLSVTTMCPHHLLPAHGTGLVAYLPSDRVAGIGAIAHVLDVLSHRLTLQERIGEQLTELLVQELAARGALCRLTLMHTCLVARGERKSSALVDTISVAGVFAQPSPERDLVLATLRNAGEA